MEQTLQLDELARHGLRIHRSAGDGEHEVRAELIHAEGDRVSPLHDALARHLTIAIEPAGIVVRFIERACASWRAPFERAVVRIGDRTIARVRGDLSIEPAGERLSPLECRFLADNGAPHPASHDAPRGAPALRTDLHTHFAACLRGAALVGIAEECDLEIDKETLADIGIRASHTQTPIRALPAPMRALIARRLEVPPDRQITFLEMERLYRLRGPITKAPRAFVPQLRAIAARYAACGVTYAELSLSTILRAGTLRAVHEHAPAIEAEHGVTLRFLAALSRHDDLEWDLDAIDRMEVLAPSPYLVGVDFMGHETNATRSFARALTEVAARMGRVRPGFAVRVHAGENPAYPANVREALELTAGCDVALRIGHGLYGADDETLALLRARRAIVEFNLTSNLSLNNVQSLEDVPLARYVRAGVEVVLGTDGPGLYGTDAALEARAARLCGLDGAALAAIAATEARYVAERLERDRAATDRSFAVPPDPPPVRYGPAVVERIDRARRERDERLRARVASLGLTWLDDAAGLAGEGRFVSIVGSWRHAWASTPRAERRRAIEVLAGLLDGLGARTVLVTGGTRYGVEGVVHRLARARGIAVLGAIARDTPPAAIAKDLRWILAIGETLYDKAAGLYALMRRLDGSCVFIGGGPIVNDEIQTAQNLRLPVLLLRGVTGASGRHAREQPHRAFATAPEALARMRRSRPAPQLWYEGPNPTADVVLLRAPGADPEVLLVRRDLDAHGEPDRWALPGGFVRSDAPPHAGRPFASGRESALDAALRELAEEAGLDLRAHAGALLWIGTYEGSGRDPRDRPSAWTRSTVFAGWLPAALAEAPLAGGDDACDARWFPLRALPPLAFDHARIAADAARALGR